MQAIIFPNLTTISVMRPLDCGLPVQEIARKDVSFGVPYRIIDAALIPEDRTYRDAWTADFSAPDGTGLGPHRWWIEQFMAEIAQLEAQKTPDDADAAERFEAERTAAIAALQAKIETMKAEVLKLEGVQL
jgi:hypothetical protein